MELRIVLVIAAIVALLSLLGAYGHIHAVQAAMASGEELEGWEVFARSAFVLSAEAISAVVAVIYIIRGPSQAANNAAAAFAGVMLLALLVKGGSILDEATWQFLLSAAWAGLLGWLLWRIVPNTSLNPDAAKRRAG